jgi:hypothetical protein
MGGASHADRRRLRTLRAPRAPAAVLRAVALAGALKTAIVSSETSRMAVVAHGAMRHLHISQRLSRRLRGPMDPRMGDVCASPKRILLCLTRLWKRAAGTFQMVHQAQHRIDTAVLASSDSHRRLPSQRPTAQDGATCTHATRYLPLFTQPFPL